MSRGMNMDEFRNALSSEATVENEQLKTELGRLKQESENTINTLQGELEQYKNWCVGLGNRCFAMTGGVLCLSCDIDCCKHAFNANDMEAVVAYMKKNKLPRNEETYLKAMEFLEKRRRNLK